MTDPIADIAILRISSAQLDAGAEALRQHEQGGRLLRAWETLPNSDKKKWRIKASVVYEAIAKAGAR